MNNLVSRNITFRLYPSRVQAQILWEWLGEHCDLYNVALDHRREAYEKHGIMISYRDQQNELPEIKKELPVLIPLGSHALQETLKRLDRAFQAFFRRVRMGETPGYPRFKSKSRFDSFCYPDPAGWRAVQKEGKSAVLHIAHCGEIRMRGRSRVRIFKGEPRTLTIKRVGMYWYATICVRYEESLLYRRVDSDRMAVGIDAGCKNLAYISDGNIIDNPRPLAKAIKRLKHQQRELSRKQKGSKNRFKTRSILQHMHRHVAYQRINFHHQISARLVRQYSFIAIEDLQLKNMSRSAKGTIEQPGKNVKAKSGLNRSILDASIGMLFQFIEYKAAEAGTWLEKVAPHGTSQLCSQCGADVPKSLSTRVHRCDCGFIADRDYNAALNILARGLKQVGLEQANVWRGGVSPPEKHETSASKVVV